MTLPGLVRANNLSDVTDREKAWDNLGNNIATGNIAIPAPSFSVNFAANQSFVDEISGNNLFTFSRASTGTFVGSNSLIQTAASGVPRFDHNPTNGQSIVLLAEAAATNSATYSEIFDNGVWQKSGASALANQAVAPDGFTTADALIESSGTSNGQSFLRFLTDSGTNTFSVYVKAASRNFFYAYFFAGQNGNAVKIIINLSTGVATFESLSQGSGNNYSYSVFNAGNGWYRISMTYTRVAGIFGARIWFGAAPTGTQSGSEDLVYTGNGQAAIYLWGAQLEAGSAPTSYIPAVASAATRATDVLTISGANLSSFYTANAGTIYTEQPRQYSSAGVVIGDSAGNRLLDWQSSRIYRTSWGGTNYTWNGALAVSATSLNRAALSYGQATRGAVNGIVYTLSPFVASGTFTTTSLTFQGAFSRIAFWRNSSTPNTLVGITSISNTEVGYLATSSSSNFTITGGDVLALAGVRNTSTRDFVRIQALTSAAQPRLTAANTSTLAVVNLSNNGLLKLSPTSSGNYSFTSELTLSGVSLRINGTNALSIGTSPFSGSTATVPMLLSNLRPQANWRITEPMTSGTIASPSLAIPFEADDFVLFMKAGQS